MPNDLVSCTPNEGCPCLQSVHQLFLLKTTQSQGPNVFNISMDVPKFVFSFTTMCVRYILVNKYTFFYYFIDKILPITIFFFELIVTVIQNLMTVYSHLSDNIIAFSRITKLETKFKGSNKTDVKVLLG